MKITSFNNAAYSEVRKRVLDALKPLSDELGLDFSIDGGQLSQKKMQLRFVVGARDAVSGQSQAEIEFRTFAARVGLSPDDYGKTFFHGTHAYKVTGLKLSAPKFNVIAERVPDGASYKFTAALVRSSLGVKTAA